MNYYVPQDQTVWVLTKQAPYSQPEKAKAGKIRDILYDEKCKVIRL
jgi:hypothetical protein